MHDRLRKIEELISEKYASDISFYDETFLDKTISGRMKDLSYNSSDAYLGYLTENRSEFKTLISYLNNSYSEFFRNPLIYNFIEFDILPVIFKEKNSSGSGGIRIWSAGCASGQEAYSLAIITCDFKDAGRYSLDFKVFGTDISSVEIKSAHSGIFHYKSLLNTKLSHLRSCFSNSGDYYTINPDIKKYVDFSVYDLLDKNTYSPPSSIYGGFDIIMCCNLLFYYRKDYQKKILEKLYLSLNTGGFLITDNSEIGLINSYGGFRQYMTYLSVFCKTDSV